MTDAVSRPHQWVWKQKVGAYQQVICGACEMLITVDDMVLANNPSALQEEMDDAGDCGPSPPLNIKMPFESIATNDGTKVLLHWNHRPPSAS